ncbi:MAG: RluA family pseudouridine synthase [Bacteroidia bacterium]|nr:RluA family pseudouridine synthase [Bacteroidia bacterium]MBP6511800.1 RluA family pseudouridine synthase [Bacteroidia bacterium]
MSEKVEDELEGVGEETNEQDQDELFEHHRFVSDKNQSMLRVDKFLFNRLVNTSRNRVQSAIEAGSVLVNTKTVKSSYKVKPGDVISVVLAHPPREIELYADDIPLDILYEDDDLFIINKQPGLVVHPAYGHYRGTLVNALVHRMYPELLDQPIAAESVRPGLVHRIDKNTSGIIVVAKHEQALSNLAKQFFDRTTNRLYVALVWGDFKEDEGTITGNVGRNLADRKVMDVFPEGDLGKHAVTHYKVLERFGYVTLIQCKLETGRTHQIRVHMKYIGHPLFNDASYGGERILKGTVFTKYKQYIENCFSLMPRHALHAKSLGFAHPRDGKPMFFDSELPEDFTAVLDKWRQYAAHQRLNQE